MLVDYENRNQDHAAQELVPVALVEAQDVLHEARTKAADRIRGRHDSGQHIAKTADDGMTYRVDRLEGVVTRVGDRVRGEAEENASNSGDCRRHTERVQLHAEHAHAQGRRGALVGPHGDQPAAGPRSAQIRHEQPDEHESDQTDDRPPVRMVDRVHIDPNEFDPADLGPSVQRVADPVRVGKEHL